jgi:hypothetical protein
MLGSSRDGLQRLASTRAFSARIPFGAKPNWLCPSLIVVGVPNPDDATAVDESSEGEIFGFNHHASYISPPPSSLAKDRLLSPLP